jgi:hypothetical protein
MPTQQPNSWKIYSIRKIVEYVTIGIALWQFGVPAVNNHIEGRIKAYEEENKSSQSFREVLSDEWGVKKDRVHIYMKNQDEKLNTVASRLDFIEGHVKEEIQNTHPGIIIKNNTEYWIANNGELYRVHRNSVDGRGSYVKDGTWYFIYW